MNNHRELLSYFNLTGLPFTKEIPVDQLHLLPSVERNLAAAQLLVDTRGIGAITGKPGTGKSCLLRLLQQRLPAGLYRTFYLCHSSVGTVEFYTHLSVIFGLQPNYRRAAMFRDIKQHVLTLNNSAHVHPVLLIDEAHLLSTEILSEIRLLTNFHVDSLNALTVILCGSENLTRKFGLSVLEALASSITVTISVDTLAADESFSFVDSRMRAAALSSRYSPRTPSPSCTKLPAAPCAPSASSPTPPSCWPSPRAVNRSRPSTSSRSSSDDRCQPHESPPPPAPNLSRSGDDQMIRCRESLQTAHSSGRQRAPAATCAPDPHREHRHARL